METLGLAIDTTFDDTSVALLRGKQALLANVTLSQYADHAEFGGVVPERASRKHLEVIHPLIERAMAELSSEHQELLRLRYWEGQSFNVIAERMEKSEAGTTMMHSRAKAALARTVNALRKARGGQG